MTAKRLSVSRVDAGLSSAASPGATLGGPEVMIFNRQRSRPINTRRLRQIVCALLAEVNISGGQLGIHLAGAKAMARVNWQFLQHEGSTDVITFDHREIEAAVPTVLHGELYIGVDDAVLQADQFHTTWQSEVVRYAVHGVLHLLGYDDRTPHLRRRMKREENRLVRRLEKKTDFAALARR
jgi:probable rRNA maturation factor